MYHPPQLFSYGTIVSIHAQSWVDDFAMRRKEKTNNKKGSYQTPVLHSLGSVASVTQDPVDPCSQPMPPPWCE